MGFEVLEEKKKCEFFFFFVALLFHFLDTSKKEKIKNSNNKLTAAAASQPVVAGRAVPVLSQHVLRDRRVPRRRGVVQQDEEQVEARQERVREVDVARDGQAVVVRAVHRVGRREHRAAGVEGGLDAGLGDGDRLLLHDLGKGGKERGKRKREERGRERKEREGKG